MRRRLDEVVVDRDHRVPHVPRLGLREEQVGAASATLTTTVTHELAVRVEC